MRFQRGSQHYGDKVQYLEGRVFDLPHLVCVRDYAGWKQSSPSFIITNDPITNLKRVNRYVPMTPETYQKVISWVDTHHKDYAKTAELKALTPILAWLEKHHHIMFQFHDTYFHAGLLEMYKDGKYFRAELHLSKKKGNFGISEDGAVYRQMTPEEFKELIAEAHFLKDAPVAKLKNGAVLGIIPNPLIKKKLDLDAFVRAFTAPVRVAERAQGYPARRAKENEGKE